MWATLALFTTLSGAVPPFQLLAMTFGVAAVIGVVIPLVRGGRPFGHYRQRPAVWLLLIDWRHQPDHRPDLICICGAQD